MRALPPLSCINYNRPRCVLLSTAKDKVHIVHHRSACILTISANFQLCVVLYMRVLHSACVCVLHPLQQEQERHYDIFSVSPTYNPQHANSYIYSFAYTSPCTQSIQILPAHTFILFLLHINVNTITLVRCTLIL